MPRASLRPTATTRVCSASLRSVRGLRVACVRVCEHENNAVIIGVCEHGQARSWLNPCILESSLTVPRSAHAHTFSVDFVVVPFALFVHLYPSRARVSMWTGCETVSRRSDAAMMVINAAKALRADCAALADGATLNQYIRKQSVCISVNELVLFLSPIYAFIMSTRDLGFIQQARQGFLFLSLFLAFLFVLVRPCAVLRHHWSHIDRRQLKQSPDARILPCAKRGQSQLCSGMSPAPRLLFCCIDS